MKLKLKVYKEIIFEYYLALALYIEIRYKSHFHKGNKAEKVLILKTSSPKRFGRYFYSLLKFFDLEGYTIFFPGISFNLFKEKFFIKDPKANQYFSLIFKEGLINFEEPPKLSTPPIILEKNSLSANYYFPFFNDSDPSTFLSVPMPMHPLLYHKNLWDKIIPETNRKRNSVFMAGNFSPVYNALDKNLFKMESRVEVFEALKRQEIISEINSKSDFNSFLNSSRDMECIVIDTNNFSFEIQELRKVLARFPFFLALPGVVMPHCHNIVEAMSVGCIPIIRGEYAKMWNPKLENLKNVVIYENVNDLVEKIKFVFTLNKSEIEIIRLEVIKYYEENLTPSTVVKKIAENLDVPIFLQAEHRSVSLLRLTLKG